ncbi:MAG: hypothetical protein ABH952_08545 [Candidatus Omnitrophota bacterium]
MIIVQEIKVANVDKNVVELAHYPPMNFSIYPGPKTEPIEITYEMIHGRTFVNANGEEFCIGLSEQAQTAIGLPFEAFENMSNEIEKLQIHIGDLRKKYNIARDKINQYETMGLWKRIKFLFGRGKSL